MGKTATLLPQLLVSNKISNSKFFVHPGEFISSDHQNGRRLNNRAVFLNTLCYGLPVALFITQVSATTRIIYLHLCDS